MSSVHSNRTSIMKAAPRRTDGARLGCLATRIAACGLLISLLGNYAQAQSLPSCAVDVATRVKLETAKLDAEDARISTARSLIDDWQVSLPTLMSLIEKMPSTDASSWDPKNRQILIFVTDVAKTILGTKNPAIALFRQCDNDKIIKTLIWAARGLDTDLRINSANILANTVDNTTVCFVLHHLRDKEIIDSGRANLLGTARAVASYAYRDIIVEMLRTIEIVRENLGPRLNSLGQTQALLSDVRARTETSINSSVDIPNSLAQYCRGYQYGPPLSRAD
jgi:hypothetical protein